MTKNLNFIKFSISKLTIILIFTVLLISCGNKNKSKRVNIDEAKLKEPVLEINKEIIKDESYLIDKYIERHQLEMSKTETGLRYSIYKKTNNNKAPKVGIVSIHYEVSLLSGEKCYSTKGINPMVFNLNNAEVINGLEEGILLMKEGEKAKLIVPAYLAFGLLGDDEKIPMRATLIYDVELIKIIK